MNVIIEISTGVVAQKYTHKASKYFLPLRFWSSKFLWEEERDRGREEDRERGRQTERERETKRQRYM